MSYRNLTQEEVNTLENQSCKAIDGWKNIFVDNNFDTSNIRNVTFSGNVYLGVFSNKIELPSGCYDFCGIYNAHIHNCTIKNQCYIKNIGASISNYIIEENVIIQDTSCIKVEKESSFGNGTEVATINEGGGRNVLIYDELSVHTAYLMAFYRHTPSMIDNLKSEINQYAKNLSSSEGSIGKNTTIINCSTICDVKIGQFAKLEGVDLLKNGSVNSTHSAPTVVGQGVNAKDFIFSSGSLVNDNAYLRHCFVGNGCEISSYYTAENSLFFANSQCLQGEACSIFAGPYTVTHHKSTLLIAGYYSYFNAGSGTNQSNHMYKLGPVHQGIIERGGKTGSDSYVLWPGQIGAFTMILGKHYSNPDISKLPFSYLIEDNGKSVLIPAQNLFNVGITRDVQKWPRRDKRKGNKHLDYLIPEALNPYTINKVLQGIEILAQLQKKASPQGKNLMYKNTQLSLTSINRGIKLYEQALVKYVGDELINVLKQPNFDSAFKSDDLDGINEWIDLGGLVCRKDMLESFIRDIENKEISMHGWDNFYAEQFKNYSSNKQQHAFQVLKSYFNIDVKSFPLENLSKFIEEWMTNNEKIKNSILTDAKKEFNPKSKIGFGIDGNDEIREQDFNAVRGNVENNSFINMLEKEHLDKREETMEILNRLNKR